MCPPTPISARCARCTITAAFHRSHARYFRSISSSPGNGASWSTGIVFT